MSRPHFLILTLSPPLLYDTIERSSFKYTFAMDEINPRKRPRPIVSCLRCRQKKLKCDRVAPCENCVKTSTASTCTYNQNGRTTAKDTNEHSAVGITNSLEDLQLRMAKVEEFLGINSRQLAGVNEVATSGHVLGTVVVKGNRSIYHGQNDRATLLNQVRLMTRCVWRQSLCVVLSASNTSDINLANTIIPLWHLSLPANGF
jgi:hypothetical protein